MRNGMTPPRNRRFWTHPHGRGVLSDSNRGDPASNGKHLAKGEDVPGSGDTHDPRPERLQWSSEHEFVVDGTRYHAGFGGGKQKVDSLRIMKLPWLIALYEELIARDHPRNIFELGIYGGGSTALVAQLAEPNKLVAAELQQQPVQGLEAFLDANDLRSRVVPYYGVDQADAPRLREIVAAEFGAEPLDLVIDDASHRVAQTRTSFEVLFPRLRAGGAYIIEDWSWAHNGGVSPWLLGEEIPLSTFVFELVLGCAYAPNAITEVTTRKGWAIVRRGDATLEQFDPSPAFDDFGRAMVTGLEATGLKLVKKAAG